jgi:hypothetical protein
VSARFCQFLTQYEGHPVTITLFTSILYVLPTTSVLSRFLHQACCSSLAAGALKFHQALIQARFMFDGRMGRSTGNDAALLARVFPESPSLYPSAVEYISNSCQHQLLTRFFIPDSIT